MTFDTLSNVAYRVSLHGPEAELGGGVKHYPRPGVFGAEHRPGAGYKVTIETGDSLMALYNACYLSNGQWNPN